MLTTILRTLRAPIAILCAYCCLFQQLEASSISVLSNRGATKAAIRGAARHYPAFIKTLGPPAPAKIPPSSPGNMLDFLFTKKTKITHPFLR